jgi:hypothetical protein
VYYVTVKSMNVPLILVRTVLSVQISLLTSLVLACLDLVAPSVKLILMTVPTSHATMEAHVMIISTLMNVNALMALLVFPVNIR